MIAPVKKTTKRKSRDEVDGNEADGASKRPGRTAKIPKKATANDNSEHVEKPDKKPKGRASTRQRKAKEDVKTQNGDSESDLSDLPSSEETDDERIESRAEVTVQNTKPEVDVGKAVDSSAPGLRRSARQR